MMINSQSPVRPESLPAPTQDAQPAGGGNGDAAANAATFAHLLRQNQTASPSASPTPAAAPAAAQAANANPQTPDAAHAPQDGGDAPAEGNVPARPQAAPRMRLKGSDRLPSAPHQPLPAARADASTTTPTTAPGADKPAGERADATCDPAAWLAALQAAPPATVATTTGERPAGGQKGRSEGGSAHDPVVGASADASTLAASAAVARGVAADKAALDRTSAGKSVDDASQGPACRIDPNLATPSTDGPQADKPSAPALPTQRPGDASAQFLSALTSAIAAPREATPAVAVTLPVRVDSPEFAPALGTQVSLLMRDGVQQAELHLNPADMGPVSVQITMDGTKAQIDFGADIAATRHAIEAGLPELASALRDAGFTLAGGGVSQHSRGSRDDDAHGRAAAAIGHTPAGRSNSAEMTDIERGATRRTVRLGGLDLYA